MRYINIQFEAKYKTSMREVRCWFKIVKETYSPNRNFLKVFWINTEQVQRWGVSFWQSLLIIQVKTEKMENSYIVRVKEKQKLYTYCIFPMKLWYFNFCSCIWDRIHQHGWWWIEHSLKILQVLESYSYESPFS